MSAPRPAARPFRLLALAVLLLAPHGCHGDQVVTVAPVDLRLDGPGDNIDDPCFWVDPQDASNASRRPVAAGSDCLGIGRTLYRIDVVQRGFDPPSSNRSRL